ncbi:UNVERIFIED_CONTAM: hypothetical protein GTU68_009145 [Idotea baltica]|nr:hypothetical protein [Idotea baltica]
MVLDAIGSIPRHLFLDKAFEEWAYKDVAFPIGSEQTISQPYTVAYQSDLLELKPKHKVLEIGTGSGYQACVLSALGAKVYSIERQQALFIKTSAFLPTIGFGAIRTLFGDGHQGIPKFAPFDRIIITASCESFPEKLIGQLKIGGKMVVPKGNAKEQTMYRITRISENEYSEESFDKFAFVPFLKGVVKVNKMPI